MHTVEINLPTHGHSQDLPDMSKPVLSIDGYPIETLRQIKIECAAEDFTTITITFDAKIKGTVFAGPKSITIEQLKEMVNADEPSAL